MARAISTDPYMDFRFGLRLDSESAWIGLSAISITPKDPGSGAGSLALEKAWGEELLTLLNLGKTNVNIGIWHISEDFGGKDPEFQIDVHGVDFQQAMIGQINLDAMSATKRLSHPDTSREEARKTRVLLGSITMDYDRCDFYIKETSFKGKPQRSVVSKARPPIM